MTMYYTGSTGDVVLPGTGAGDTPGVGKKVKVGGRSMRLKLEWTARRVGGPAVAPDPNPTDPNLVLEDFTFGVGGLDVGADGVSPDNVVSGTYWYGVLDPSKVKLVAPISPHLDTSLVTDLAMNPISFAAGLILTGGKSLTNVLTSNGTVGAPADPFPADPDPEGIGALNLQSFAIPPADR
jgi:hypothetical protein